jgi:hypothetical protein
MRPEGSLFRETCSQGLTLSGNHFMIITLHVQSPVEVIARVRVPVSIGAGLENEKVGLPRLEFKNGDSL